MDKAIDIIAAYVTALAASDIKAMQALWSDEYVLDWVHGDAFENNPLTTAETAAFWPAWFAAFPEMDYEVTRTIAGETVVVTQWIFTGVHTQPLGPPVFEPAINPRDRTISFRGVSFYDVANSKIQHETTYLDLATLMVELGVSL